MLQRDLGRERKRLQDAEKAAVASRTRSKSLSRSPTSTRVPLPGSSSDAASAEPLTIEQRPQMSPPPTSGGSGGSAGRRGSTISLSSLHRPAFPHKLDISSTTLRLTAEEVSMFSSGPLASPVSLAPKSARPSTNTDIPDFMAAFGAATDANNRPVDIDLTLPDTDPPGGNVNPDVRMNAGLGNSVDKPIELDLDGMDIDMSDLFGDTVENGSNDSAGLFSPATAGPELPMQDGKLAKENLGMGLLDALSAVEGTEGNDDLFASFSQSNNQPSGQHQSQSHITSEGLSVPVASGGTKSAPSPGSILESFTASQMNTGNQSSSSDAQNLPVADAVFDMDSIDLSVFNGGPGSETMAEIEELLKSGGFGSSA